VAWTLLDRLCFGATFDHLMGGAREYWEFASGGGDYSVTDTIEVNYSANTFQLGTSVQFARFSLAAMYEPALTMNAHRFLRIHGVVGDSERQYRISLPRTLRFGAGVSPVAGLGLSAGIDLLPWSGATIDARTAGFRDVARLSAGLEYEITPGHPLRLGYSHQRWYFDAASIVDPGFGTIPIAEQGLHAGTSIPVPKFGTLDLAASVLLRAAGDLRETAGRLSVTLAYGESWTRRTRRWGY
jgi:hypothetical protein